MQQLLRYLSNFQIPVEYLFCNFEAHPQVWRHFCLIYLKGYAILGALLVLLPTLIKIIIKKCIGAVFFDVLY